MNSDSFHWGFRQTEDDGETMHLRNLGPQRTYGTCSFGDATNFPSIFCSTRSNFIFYWCPLPLITWVTRNYFRTSPLARQNRECLIHIVNSNETMAGIALKYDISVEDIRRTNGLWTNDNVWPGQRLKIPFGEGNQPISSVGSSTTLSKSDLKLANSHSFSIDNVPTPTEFLSKLDSSIEETKKATKNMRTSKSSHQISAWTFPFIVFIPKI